jgi:hypothetical protein
MAEHRICPSATGESPDARIIGFIGADGVVGSIAPPIPLTDEMRGALAARPERKFRLAGQCVEAKCGNWEHQSCALIGRMRQQIDRLLPEAEPTDTLQRCAIRSACVWWRQDGPQACRVCSFVIYNPSE